MSTIDDEDEMKDYGLIENKESVIIDGCNVAEERKFLIHTDKYSIGEDGLIDGEIPFTDICYDLALQLQRAKAENERLSELTCVNCGEKFLSPTGSELYEKIVQLKAENGKLKQVLEDVREWFKNWQLKHTNELLNLINEVLQDVGN